MAAFASASSCCQSLTAASPWSRVTGAGWLMGELHDKHPKDPRWKTMIARVLPPDIDPRKVAILLADQHVAGKVRWDAHEKAGQVYRMNRDLKIPLDEIAVALHVSKSTVSRILKAYAFMMDQFLAVDKGAYAKIGERTWSWFDEMFRSKDLVRRLEEDSAFGDNFCRWVGDGRIPKAENVRKLAAVLGNREARKKFESLGVGIAWDEAMKIIDADDPEESSDFFKLLAKMRDNCTNAAQVKEILRIRTDPKARKKVLDTYDALVDFMRLADVVPGKPGGREAA
jgi:hypothetical protein